MFEFCLNSPRGLQVSRNFFIFLRHYSVIGKQLLFANNRNRIRWAVLGLSQDEDWIDLFENFSMNSLKGDLSNAITFNPPLFSLVSSFKAAWVRDNLSWDAIRGWRELNLSPTWWACIPMNNTWYSAILHLSSLVENSPPTSECRVWAPAETCLSRAALSSHFISAQNFCKPEP